MLTDTQEDFPRHSFRCYWPQEFKKRRRFVREEENQPYITGIKKWLLASLDDCGGEDDDDEADEDEDKFDDNVEDVVEVFSDTEAQVNGQRDVSEDKDQRRKDDEKAESCSEHGSVRLFMTGMTGDEDALQFPDQVEQVASFCEQASSRTTEKKMALLDDRTNGGTMLKKSGHYRPYKGPLSSQQLRVELSKKVTYISLSHGSSTGVDTRTAFQSRGRTKYPYQRIFRRKKRCGKEGRVSRNVNALK